MAKNRPTVRDRNIAEAIASLPIGGYSIIVEADDHTPLLRIEGATFLFLGKTRVLIVPVSGQQRKAA